MQYATHGVRLFGVGSKTVVRDVQVHRSPGNGVEVVGGTVPLQQLALTSAGAASCWGRNDTGQLGDGTTTARLVPSSVIGGIVFRVP